LSVSVGDAPRTLGSNREHVVMDGMMTSPS